VIEHVRLWTEFLGPRIAWNEVVFHAAVVMAAAVLMATAAVMVFTGREISSKDGVGQ
jgi:hypothetical protein